MDRQKTTLRVATLADDAKLATLVNDAFLPERAFTDVDRTSPEKIRDLFHKGRFFVLEEDTNIVGCIYAELRGEGGYFGLLAVDPSCQKSGYGAKLIAAAENYCKSAGCRFMDLTIVSLRAELPAYYRRFGYIESGILPFTPERPWNRPCHLIWMTKPLV